jgi:hypothetical protein
MYNPRHTLAMNLIALRFLTPRFASVKRVHCSHSHGKTNSEQCMLVASAAHKAFTAAMPLTRTREADTSRLVHINATFVSWVRAMLSEAIACVARGKRAPLSCVSGKREVDSEVSW